MDDSKLGDGREELFAKINQKVRAVVEQNPESIFTDHGLCVPIDDSFFAKLSSRSPSPMAYTIYSVQVYYCKGKGAFSVVGFDDWYGCRGGQEDVRDLVDFVSETYSRVCEKRRAELLEKLKTCLGK